MRAVAASLNGFCSALATRRESERAETAALRAQLQRAEQESRALRRERDQVTQQYKTQLRKHSYTDAYRSRQATRRDSLSPEKDPKSPMRATVRTPSPTRAPPTEMVGSPTSTDGGVLSDDAGGGGDVGSPTAVMDFRQPTMLAPGMEEVHVMSNKILAQQLLVTQDELTHLREEKRILAMEVLAQQEMLRRVRAILSLQRQEKFPVCDGDTGLAFDQAVKRLKVRCADVKRTTVVYVCGVGRLRERWRREYRLSRPRVDPSGSLCV